MAISELVVDIKCKKRPWFRVAFCVCYVLHKARIISDEAAARFLVNHCMTMSIEGPRPEGRASS